jgi:2,4-dienoyl-CoA reductase
MDVRHPDSINAAIDTVLSQSGSLPHVIVNNAAGNFISPTENLSTNAWRSITEIVYLGTVNVTTIIGKRWIAARLAKYGNDLSKLPKEAATMDPQVVFMAVGTSYVATGCAFLAPSAAAKAAVWSMTQSLSVEWGKYNIRLFMVSPGGIYTDGAFSRLDPTGQASDPARIASVVPLGRLGNHMEYVNMVAYLTSDAASWLSGANVHFDGGSHAGGGEFRPLRDVTPQEWKILEQMIRKTDREGGSKSKI